jgi:ribonuclease VapC
LNKVVLDASALLALLNAEPGSEEVEGAIPGAAISAVNLSEVVAKLVENGMPEKAVRSILGDIELEIHPFDLETAYRAGSFRNQKRHLELSFGDRACLAFGSQLGVSVLTRAGRSRPPGGPSPRPSPRGRGCKTGLSGSSLSQAILNSFSPSPFGRGPG